MNSLTILYSRIRLYQVYNLIAKLRLQLPGLLPSCLIYFSRLPRWIFRILLVFPARLPSSIGIFWAFHQGSLVFSICHRWNVKQAEAFPPAIFFPDGSIGLFLKRARLLASLFAARTYRTELALPDIHSHIVIKLNPLRGKLENHVFGIFGLLEINF